MLCPKFAMFPKKLIVVFLFPKCLCFLNSEYVLTAKPMQNDSWKSEQDVNIWSPLRSGICAAVTSPRRRSETTLLRQGVQGRDDPPFPVTCYRFLGLATVRWGEEAATMTAKPLYVGINAKLRYLAGRPVPRVPSPEASLDL